MNINWKRIPKVLHEIEFEVSGDPDWTPYGLTITPETEAALQKSNKLARRGKMQDEEVALIKGFMRQFPEVPMFYNHLFNYYILAGQLESAKAIAEESSKAHPFYFYNGIMQTTLWIESGADLSGIPALMRHWNIVAYAGGRAKFENHEVLAFYLIAAHYHLLIDEVRAADMFVYFLEVMDDESEHPNVKAFRQKVDRMMVLHKMAKSGRWVKK